MPTKILKVHLLDPVTLRTVCNLAAGKLLYTSDLLHGSEGKVTCRRCIVISSRRDNPAVKETT